MAQNVLFTLNPGLDLENLLAVHRHNGVFVVTDENVAQSVLPHLIAAAPSLKSAQIIAIKPGDGNKSLGAATEVWHRLVDSGATRQSLVVNIGGGMVTDLGGFVAATFKRGIDFINLPTTLLGAVDAAVGGKTGINFAGLKNEVGVFSEARAVIVSSSFFSTLPIAELLSGYGEVIKHALLESSEALADVLRFPILDPAVVSSPDMLGLLKRSVEVKRRIVLADPHEQGIRKSLNLGHTAAHAFESMALMKDATLPHGHAVAYGLIVDLVLSHMLLAFPSAILHAVASFVAENYPTPVIDCSDYSTIIGLMRHDKKNNSVGEINFTLLRSPGVPSLNVDVAPDDITAALDIMRDLLHA